MEPKLFFPDSFSRRPLCGWAIHIWYVFLCCLLCRLGEIKWTQQLKFGKEFHAAARKCSSSVRNNETKAICALIANKIFFSMQQLVDARNTRHANNYKIRCTTSTNQTQNECASYNCTCLRCQCVVSYSVSPSPVRLPLLISYAWCICSIRKNKHLALWTWHGMYQFCERPKKKIIPYFAFVGIRNEVNNLFVLCQRHRHTCLSAGNRRARMENLFAPKLLWLRGRNVS